MFLSLATLVGMSVIRRLLTRLLEGRFQDRRARYQFTKSLALASSIVTLVVIGTIWLGAIKHMGTFLGLATAGAALALKDLIADIAGWAFIMWKRPFDVGDRIEIAGFAGDVVDIRIFEFTLLEIGNWVDADQSTGRVVHIPNQKLLSEPIANYTAEFPYVWNEIPVLVTFESDWKKAKAILAQVVEEETGELSRRAKDIIPRATRRLLISYRTLSATVYTTVRDSGVLLTDTAPGRAQGAARSRTGHLGRYSGRVCRGARHRASVPDPADLLARTSRYVHDGAASQGSRARATHCRNGGRGRAVNLIACLSLRN